MKIMIVLGMVIIFISMFFILLTGDSMFRAGFDCDESAGKTVCEYKGFDSVSAFGVFIIAFFVMIDIMAVYMMLTNLE